MDYPVTILYVEKDQDGANAFVCLARDRGLMYEVTSVDTLSKARTELVTRRFDIAVADGDFSELLGYLHDTPSILLIRDQQDMSKLRTLKHRADDYVPKDGQGRYLAVLLLSIRAILDRRATAPRLPDIGFLHDADATDEAGWTSELCRALFDRAKDCIFLLDLNGRFIDANRSTLDLIGYTREDIADADIFMLMSPDQAAFARQRIQQTVREGCTSDPAEFRLIRKDGEAVCLETKSSLVLHKGKPVAIQGIGRDITGRRRMEEALKESEEKFRGLAENMRAAAGVVQGMRFVYVNRYMAEMLGYSVEEILSLDFPALIHPDDREWMVDRARRRQLGEPVPGNYEFTALTKNGDSRRVDFSVGSMVYRGKPAIVGTGIDITERKKSEERLRSYAAGLKLLADSATRLLSTERPGDSLGGIFDAVAAHIGVRIYLNYFVEKEGKTLRLQRHRGLAPEIARQMELVEFGRTFCSTAAQERRPLVVNNLQQSVDPKAAFLKTLGIKAYACHPLLGHGGIMGTLSFCADDRDSFNDDEVDLMRIISHQAAMALEHQQLTLELGRRAAELSEANAAKDHFIAVLSHELRTPLTPVVMGLSLIQDKLELDPDMREMFEKVRLNVEMEARLIDDLLDVTRIARGKIELKRSVTELSKIVLMAIEVCNPDIEAHGLHFTVDFGPSPSYWVDADASRLQQVFWNVLKNAIKFTPHGGSVTVSCRPEGRQAVVEVSDTGIGIEPESLPRVFSAFEQTNQSGLCRFGGLGLGLAISKALVELHGGRIEARSEGKDKGATFRITLPLSATAGRPEAPKAAAAELQRMPALRVLLVEDHGVTAQMIRMILSEKGHTVTTAGDVSSALNLAGQRDFDLVLSDLGLPDGSGYDLLRELRNRGHGYPSIALSGYGQEEDIRKSAEAGFTCHLTKPASRDAIYDAVAAAVTSPVPQPAQIPVFNADEARKLCFGKSEMVHEMASFFMTDSLELVSGMNDALEKGDLEAIGKAAHRLKNSTVYLAARPSTDAAIRLEKAAKTGDRIATGKALRELEHEVSRLTNALKTYCRPA